MNQRQRALRRIDQVLELDAHPDVAYPLRARLGRALHEVLRWVEQSDDRSLDTTWFRSVQARAERIIQPSEPFDKRWHAEWAEMMRNLRQIRTSAASRPE
jgi:hypothetical protein